MCLADAGIRESFVQDNHSHSSRGVLRGLHYQLRHPQAKLCRVTQGEVLDVAVDVRVGSPNFGKWVGVVAVGRKPQPALHPQGIRARLCGAIREADFLYKCSDYFDAGDDRGVLWNDPGIGIDWQMRIADPVGQGPALSAAVADPTGPVAEVPAMSLRTADHRSRTDRWAGTCSARWRPMGEVLAIDVEQVDLTDLDGRLAHSSRDSRRTSWSTPPPTPPWIRPRANRIWRAPSTSGLPRKSPTNWRAPAA